VTSRDGGALFFCGWAYRWLRTDGISRIKTWRRWRRSCGRIAAGAGYGIARPDYRFLSGSLWRRQTTRGAKVHGGLLSHRTHSLRYNRRHLFAFV